MQRIVNVTTPTLTAYLPDPAKATGTAVIIAPGGGLFFLGSETHDVAEWLAARGICGIRPEVPDELSSKARTKRN